jgi:hypothetical protein
MFSTFRYFATVRRARSIPCSFHLLHDLIVVQRILAILGSMMVLSFSLTASQLMSSPSALVVPPRKTCRSGNTPRGV